MQSCALFDRTGGERAGHIAYAEQPSDFNRIVLAFLTSNHALVADKDFVPKIIESFKVAQSAERVWAFFQQIPEVVTCLPGLALTGQPAPDVYRGQIKVKLGAVTAAFEGEATILESNPESYTTRIKGKGVDKKGGSRAQAEFTYQLTPEANGTLVMVVADITLTGPLAQFGRTGILHDVAREMTAQFATNLETKLAASAAGSGTVASVEHITAQAPAELSASRLLLAMIRGRWRALGLTVSQWFSR